MGAGGRGHIDKAEPARRIRREGAILPRVIVSSCSRWCYFTRARRASGGIHQLTVMVVFMIGAFGPGQNDRLLLWEEGPPHNPGPRALMCSLTGLSTNAKPVTLPEQHGTVASNRMTGEMAVSTTI